MISLQEGKRCDDVASGKVSAHESEMVFYVILKTRWYLSVWFIFSANFLWSYMGMLPVILLVSEWWFAF